MDVAKQIRSEIVDILSKVDNIRCKTSQRKCKLGTNDERAKLSTYCL